MLTLKDVQSAAERIGKHVINTDITSVPFFKGNDGFFIKAENLQRTGSFKIRGALNQILQLSDDQKNAGVIAGSAGNHAQGMALSAKLAGVPCTIVMPKNAALSKIMATERFGAKVVLFGDVYDEACEHAVEMADKEGMTFIHAFDNEQVIAGQGTVALEIMQTLPNVKCIAVPIGGGGLAAGVALAAKSLNPDIKVIGVEAAGAASMLASVKAKRAVTLADVMTFADGIAVKTPGAITLELCSKYLDEIITVNDDDIAITILHLLERCKIVSEGAGASAAAAVLTGKIKTPDTVAVLSGGNIDVTVIERIISKGLIRQGRKIEISTVLPDKPGQLSRILSIVAMAGGNVDTVKHDRLAADTPLGFTKVFLDLETRDSLHGFEIIEALKAEGYQVGQK